jgi:signal transduction histidine kinase
MEAVGQLTGGIAHDFNNLLTVVTGNIDMANRSLAASGSSDARARRALDNAQKGAERAAALTQRLLAFSRRQPLAPKPIEVDRLVLGISDMLNRALARSSSWRSSQRRDCGEWKPIPTSLKARSLTSP